MKKEIIAAAILVVLIGLSFFNISYVEHKTEMLKQDVEKARDMLSAGDAQAALEQLGSSLKSWQSFSYYAGVMLRHSDEITDVSDSYFEVMKELEQTGGAPDVLFDKLVHILTDIADVESLHLSSLF